MNIGGDKDLFALNLRKQQISGQYKSCGMIRPPFLIDKRMLHETFAFPCYRLLAYGLRTRAAGE
jgi:hypothetical protein